MAEHTQSGFARLAGVSRNAIIKAMAEGRLIKTNNKTIDDKNSLAVKYLRNQLQKSKGGEVKKKVQAKIREKKPQIKKVKNKVTIIKPKIEKKAPKILTPSGYEGAKKTKAEIRKDRESELKQKGIDAELEQQYYDKEEIDIEYKKANTEKIKISNAEKLKLLVPMEFVAKKFGKLSAVIINYFFPMGGRLAPIVCGACKITDPKIIKKVEAILNNEITRALSEFKRASAEEVGE